MSPASREEQVMQTLEGVLDPCSCFTDNPISIVDLGLIEEITVNGDMVAVELLLTSPMCMHFLDMSQEITAKLERVEWVETATVTQSGDGVWTRDRMAGDSLARRRERFEAEMAEYGIEPDNPPTGVSKN